MRCLVTGATGYVGGRLVPRLLAESHQVRCLARSAGRLRDLPWADQVEVVEGDVTTGAGLDRALDGIEVAYYLVHALGQHDFERIDRESAEDFVAAAARSGVRRVVYLGGPTPHDTHAGQVGGPASGPGQAAGHSRDNVTHPASAHLRSRAEVADILLAGAVPAVVLRAAVMIGSGSASFEMLRYLTERLPVMVTPRWVSNRIEPIAIRDVLRYLVAAATAFPDHVNRAFDIGGGEVLRYVDMMRRYAEVAGLPHRVILPVRPLTPALSALWVGLVTPVPGAIARPLVASLIHEAVAHEHDIADYIPDPPGGLTGVDESIRLALRKVRDADVETRWSGATWPGAPTESLPADPLPTDPQWTGGTVYTDVRQARVEATTEDLWRVVESIGGENGWYSSPLAWQVRGLLDRMVGGVGLRRGRRDQKRLYVGESVDFWRVEDIVPGHLLRLRAEMRLPGLAWLELRVDPDRSGARLTQRAIFLPRGLLGQAYWASMVPFHRAIFADMARNLARAAA